MSKWLVVAVIVLGVVGFSVTVGAVNATGPETAVHVESATDAAAAAYAWYLDLQSAEVLLNPLLDGTYQDRPDLSADFIARLDAQVAAASGSGLAVDPLLCLADELPRHVAVELVRQDEDTAQVLLTGGGLAQYPLADVELIMFDGGWQIDSVNCQ